jgi:hypothetical protein
MENVGGRGGETPDTSKLPTILEKSKDYIKVMWPQLEIKFGLAH